ncbi:hypothetical protein B0H11DRAFT_1905970 [Mycena galericulata]|nr:hypothetical protein B0H11DRAFT_1905970 [Mycena galericulata]
MAPRSLPPLGPPPAHCLPPVPAFTEPICRNCIANWKLVVKLQAECQRLSRDVVKSQEQRFDLGFNMVARLFREFEDLYESCTKTADEVDPSAPDMKHTDHTSERSEDESDPRTTNRIEQAVASQDEALYHGFEDLAESCTRAPDQVDPSARGVPNMEHKASGTKAHDEVEPSACGVPDMGHTGHTSESSRTADFPCGILVGHRMGIDIPVSVLWKDAPGEVLFRDDGSAFRLHLTAGPTNAITGAIFKCSKNSHEDLVNMRPEHQTAAKSFAESRL